MVRSKVPQKHDAVLFLSRMSIFHSYRKKHTGLPLLVAGVFYLLRCLGVLATFQLQYHSFGSWCVIFAASPRGFGYQNAPISLIW